MRFGLHLSISKGLLAAVEEAQRLQCETLQIFTRSPRMWRTKQISKDDADAFNNALRSADIHPLAVHTPYLPNLCTSNQALYQRSLDAFQEDVASAELLQANYLVIHPGAYSPESTEAEGYKNIVQALDTIFSFNTSVTVLLENMSGGGRRLGSSFEGLAWIINKSKISKRLGICLDTCHSVGAGFDLSAKKGVGLLVKTIEESVGLDKVKLLHINDSKSPVGSHLDRHEHIGNGFIGEKGFSYFLQHSAFKYVPAILETPKDSPQADINNLRRIRELAKNTHPALQNKGDKQVS